MSPPAITAMKRHTSFLAHAEAHVGDAIQTLRTMQDLEQMDIIEGFDNRLLLHQLGNELDSLGRPDLAAMARKGAEREESQIARNERLIKDQGAMIGVLQVIANGLGAFSLFANRITRAVSNLFA